jgi:hypothetical protein
MNDDRGATLPKRPWYRGRAALVGVAVAAVLAVTIVTDRPPCAYFARL